MQRLPPPFTSKLTFKGLSQQNCNGHLYYALIYRGQLPTNPKPIEITVSMPGEFASHLVPIIETRTIAPLIKEDSDEIASNPSRITFLPLPSSFDYTKQSSWAALASEIQEWLLALVVSRKSPERSWATDCFWMAYLAAYPDFPRGQWTLWDPRISICETFAERWTMTATGNFAIRDSVEHDETCNDSCAACIQSRRELWEEFTRHASLFYVDGPLVRQA